MKPRVVVLSGRVGSGRTTLSECLRDSANATLIRSKDLIAQQLPKTKHSRRAFQAAGLRLDRETDGRWLTDALVEQVAGASATGFTVIDSVRTPKQIEALRQSGWHVTHVHLTASDPVLKQRYSLRSDNTALPYAAFAKGAAEKRSAALSSMADVVIDTERCNSGDVYARVMARIETRPLLCAPLIDVLVGGQYGSEGKGNIANYLAPEYDVLVRVGGPNAGHKVFRSGSQPYTFRQLPSGAIANPQATLVLGAGAVVSLQTLLREIADLAIPFDKLIVDGQAMIIEEADRQWEEENLKSAIGSTAQGIGSATARKILHRWPESDVRLAKDVPELARYIRDSVEFFAKCMAMNRKILLEGTQGTTLSIHHGHYPHVTSRMTTAAACLAEAGLSSRHVRRIIMVCRTYPIRVGDSVSGQTSGFMSQPLQFEEIARRSGIDADKLLKAEIGSVSSRPRRVAEFDWAQLRRSLLLNGPTDICLTFADYLGATNADAFRYEQLNSEALRFIEELEKVSGVSVSLISTAFRERNVIDRRLW